MFKKISIVLGLVIILAVASCSKKRGTSAGIPTVTPIVQDATPDSLENFTAGLSVHALSDELGALATSLSCTSGSSGYTLINSLACRLFTDGPANIFDIVSSIDGRINSLNTRSAESTHACLSATPVDLSSHFVMPDNSSGFTFYGQCYEVLSDTSSIVFGKKDNVWYLSDRSSAALSVVMVDASNNMEGYFVVGLSNSPWDSQTRSIMHFKANPTTKSFEFSVAGVGVGFCSSRVTGNADHIYIEGEDNDSVASTSCASFSSKCASASDLSETTSTNCTTLSSALTVSTLGRAQTAGTSGTFAAAAHADYTLNLDTGFSFGITNSDLTAGISGLSSF